MSYSHKNTPIHYCNYMMHWFMVYYARVAKQKLHNRTLHGLFRQIKVGSWSIETSTCIALFSREVCVTNSSWNIASRSIFSLSYRKFALIMLQSFNANIFIKWFKVNVKHCSQPILLPWRNSEWNKIFDEKNLWCSNWFYLFETDWIMKNH